MKDITTMDFQNVFIVHAMNVANILFGPFRLVDCGIMEKAYESIIEVINNQRLTEKDY